MSTGAFSTQVRPRSQSSKHSDGSLPPPVPTLTPANDIRWEPCATTASFLLYASSNKIFCLHHDTLATERVFERHGADVQWISVDNVSDGGAGRLVVSYDATQTTIVWDLMTGAEIARFASYEEIRVAVWMKNGNIAFGNAQGNVILFEPSSSEHISARTIFDPITALAPAADCRTYAIGYANGSILIATLQPSFTILHTLSTTRYPCPIQGLAWHGSSAKQKSDMLASQTADGDLRVWSIPKVPLQDPPTVIRVLNRTEHRLAGPCWFAWSKLGRIVQYSDGQTLVWDVRTKRVTYETVPTLDGIVAISNYGPTATLFTLGRNYSVQQYDLNPNRKPMLVANVQLVPPNLPPSPPKSVEEPQRPLDALAPSGGMAQFPVQLEFETTSEEDFYNRSQEESDEYRDESRDRLGPLSPQSSRSSASSRSERDAHRRARRSRKLALAAKEKLKAESPLVGSSSSASASESTVFSGGSHLSASTRSALESSKWGYSTSGFATSNYSTSAASSSRANTRPSQLRKETVGNPEMPSIDLFPYTKARLSEVPFRAPQVDPVHRNPEDLRRLMLHDVFGWDDDIQDLIREERAQHPIGSSSGIILSKWLGDLDPDAAASIIGSNTMTSSDWMLLALSTMGEATQKKVGETFVQRLLEKSEIHPAVALLLSLGDHDEAVEVYVSRKFYMEALLLACLISPANWQRQSHLLHKWGELSVVRKQPELALRCFSFASIESSEAWYSPRATEAVEGVQARMMESHLAAQPPLSPPPSSTRLHPGNLGLKLITDFGKGGLKNPMSGERTPMGGMGVTPIAESALSPGGAGWQGANSFSARGSATATATPGGYNRSRRFPSRSSVDRRADTTPIAATPNDRKMPTPRTAINEKGQATDTFAFARKSRSMSAGGASAPAEAPQTLSAAIYQANEALSPGSAGARLTSSTEGLASHWLSLARARNPERDRKPDLHLTFDPSSVVERGLSSIDDSKTDIQSTAPSSSKVTSRSKNTENTSKSTKSIDRHLQAAKIRSIDQYISSIQEANFHSSRQRSESRKRAYNQDREARSRGAIIEDRTRADPISATRSREPSEARGRKGVRYIQPAKRSPSSPVSMSPDDANLMRSSEMELFYTTKSTSTAGRSRGRSRHKAVQGTSKTRSVSRTKRVPSADEHNRSRSRAAYGRAESQERTGRALNMESRGRQNARTESAKARSPSSPLPMTEEGRRRREEIDEAEMFRTRHSSLSRDPHASSLDKHRERSLDRYRERSQSRPRDRGERAISRRAERSAERCDQPGLQGQSSRQTSRSRMPRLQTDLVDHARRLTKKELAAKELEERRLSLARRPSAPAIPHPDELGRVTTSAKSAPTGKGVSPHGNFPGDPLAVREDVHRSPVDERELVSPIRHTRNATTGTIPMHIGLPATPSAMKYPQHLQEKLKTEHVPAVPTLPTTVNDNSTAQQQPVTLAPTVFGGPNNSAILARSASVPLENAMSPSFVRRGSINSRGGHSRKASATETPHLPIMPPPHPHPALTIAIPSIEATLAAREPEAHIVVVPDKGFNLQPQPTPVLPELQHLASPPPPPPPPSAFSDSSGGKGGMISIAFDNSDPQSVVHPSSTSPPPVEVALSNTTPSTSPVKHRRGRGSVSETVGQKLRSVRERLRSSSRGRTEAASGGGAASSSNTPSPYESVLPPGYPFPGSRTMSPKTAETNAQGGASQLSQGYGSPVQGPADSPSTAAMESLVMSPTHIGGPVPSRPGSAGVAMTAEQIKNHIRQYQGYRNPKEIRANMPPDQLQFGVTNPFPLQSLTLTAPPPAGGDAGGSTQG